MPPHLSLSSLLNPSPQQDSFRDNAPSEAATEPTLENGVVKPSCTVSRPRHEFEHHQLPGSDNSTQLPKPLVLDLANPPPTSILEQYNTSLPPPEQRGASEFSAIPADNELTLPPITLSTYTEMETLDSQQLASGLAQQAQTQPPLGRQEMSPSDITEGLEEHDTAAPDTLAQDVSHPPDMHTQPKLPSPTVSDDAAIKQESMATPTHHMHIDALRIPDLEQQSLKSVTSLKNEHGTRTHSPLRESSVPVPTTETPALDAVELQSKKRPASARTKKGTATTMKRAPVAKKRKLETKRSSTPSSQSSKGFLAKGIKKQHQAASSPAPSTRSQSADPDDDDEDIDVDDDDNEGTDDPDADVYCICRKQDTGTFMIGCDGKCDDWFHGKCVGVEERDKNLIDCYICPNCTEAGIGRTTWKRMCRRHGCRQAARINKSKGGGHGSKYCSDECGVLFFREMASRTRGQQDGVSNRHRSSRPRNHAFALENSPDDDDLGARGGVISAGEVKALLNASSSAKDFRDLGTGVLSPPTTPPDGKLKPADPNAVRPDYETKEIHEIQDQKEDARRRHALLKERIRFVGFVKQAASRVAEQKSLKPKEYCGYDARLEWSEARFQTWRNSDEGRDAFESEIVPLVPLDTDRGGVTTAPAIPESSDVSICERKKCVRHHEWAKLAMDDLRFEMSDNSDRMRSLEIAEASLREHIAMCVRAGKLLDEGSVEVHEPANAPLENEPLENDKGLEVQPVACSPKLAAPLMPDKMEIDDSAV